jgi:hypothetical protein
MMNILDIKNALTIKKEELGKLPIHISAFCSFMVKDYVPYIEERLLINSENQESTYGYASYLGYLIAIGIIDDNLLNEFRSEITHLSGKTFFSSNRVARFEIDGVALLGVAAGLFSIECSSEEKQWFLELLSKSIETLENNKWEVSFAQGALELLSGKNWSSISDSMLRVAIPYAMGEVPEASLRETAWSMASIIETKDDDVIRSVKRSVFDYCVYFLSNLPINDVTTSEIVKLLHNISESMSHWTYEVKSRTKGAEIRKWDIDNEYHVQNLLWTILKPIFPDLVDEEYLPTIGHMTPRSDLGIPSLQTIIEVKFMKNSGQTACKKITEEIAADSAVYLTPNSKYEQIIVFIWDNCRQTEEYRILKDGLKSLEGIEDVVILSRPNRMVIDS